MTPSEIVEHLYKFYPRNISYYDEAYSSTEEYNRLATAISNKSKREWIDFLSELSTRFTKERVIDRTDAEPANRCVIYIYKEDLIFELVIHVSMIINLSSFFVRKAFVDRDIPMMRPLGFQWNKPLPEIEEEVDFILKSLKSLYPEYEIMPEGYNEILIPDIASRDKLLGQTSIFTAAFANTLL